jgi:uncharacterized protein YutE (UPF0331/DUF86 family)
VVGFRNVLAHGYMEVQWSAIERILKEDLPFLKAVVKVEQDRFMTSSEASDI